ncbi:hypothetical protein HBB16_04830 [Pseudonocardia sp. MCCB 268]|nr:hypothetical protein [Pseudonocardia cytotoxica]
MILFNDPAGAMPGRLRRGVRTHGALFVLLRRLRLPAGRSSARDRAQRRHQLHRPPDLWQGTSAASCSAPQMQSPRCSTSGAGSALHRQRESDRRGHRCHRRGPDMIGATVTLIDPPTVPAPRPPAPRRPDADAAQFRRSPHEMILCGAP